jgi:hypothetical protein
MRSTHGFTTGLVVVGLALASTLALGGCASDGAQEPSSSTAGGEAAKPAPQKGVAPPSGHPLAKVEMNMAPSQVQEIMGAPTNTKSYITGKSFIPWYFGSDSGSRVEYAYKGQGRVVFAVNRWSGQQKVLRIDYDPNEDGH